LTIGQILRVVRGRWWLALAVFALVVGAVVALSLWLPKQYTATTAIVIDFRGTDPISGAVPPGQMLPSYIATQVDLIQSHGVARRVVDHLKLTENEMIRKLYQEEAEGRGSLPDWVAQLLLKRLKLQPARDSTMVKISYTSNDGKFSALIANAFADAYVKMNLDFRTEPARQASTWFDGQLKDLKESLDRSQARVSEFQRTHGIVASDERIDVENARLNELTSQLVVVQAQTYEGIARRRQLGAPATAQDVIANPVVQRLKGEIATAEGKLSELSARVGPHHPLYESLQEQLSGLRAQLKRETDTVAGGVRSASSATQEREGSVAAALREQKAKVLKLKQERDDMLVLQREADSAQRAYEVALQRVTQTRLEGRINQTNVALVYPAVEPVKHSQPRLLLNTVLAIIAGLNLGIGAAVLREFFDRRVRAPADLAAAGGAPVLSELPAQTRPAGWRRWFSRRGRREGPAPLVPGAQAA
jgi:polysaccharide biosynthesis transport protein